VSSKKIIYITFEGLVFKKSSPKSRCVFALRSIRIRKEPGPWTDLTGAGISKCKKPQHDCYLTHLLIKISSFPPFSEDIVFTASSMLSLFVTSSEILEVVNGFSGYELAILVIIMLTQ
jgi:hypothetical protein